MAAVYILYSHSIDKFYVGSCLDFDSRLSEHLSKKYAKSYTAKTIDWKIICKGQSSIVGKIFK